jgi:hypothetical protein
MIKEKNLEKRLRIESYEYLNERLSYDKDTGIIRWKILFPNKIAGTKIKGGYIKLSLEKIDFKAHRLCWILHYRCRPSEHMHIDHLNGNTSDNRIQNLRLCKAKNNSANSKKPKSNTSGYKGVTTVKGSPKYRAYICVNRKQIHLGMHDKPEDAYRAYCNAANKYFGEYACIQR